MVSSLLLENNLLSEIKTLVLTTGTLYKIYKHELSEWQENKLVKKLRTPDTHCLFFSHISLTIKGLSTRLCVFRFQLLTLQSVKMKEINFQTALYFCINDTFSAHLSKHMFDFWWLFSEKIWNKNRFNSLGDGDRWGFVYTTH